MNLDNLVTLINLLTPVIVFLVSLAVNGLYARLSKDQQGVVRDTANLVVPAIEQAASALSGAQKREAAVQRIQEILVSVGVRNVNPALIDAAVESAVYAMNQSRMTASTVKVPVVRQ